MDRRGEGDNYYTVGVKNINHLNLLIGADDISKKGILKLMDFSQSEVGYTTVLFIVFRKTVF